MSSLFITRSNFFLCPGTKDTSACDGPFTNTPTRARCSHQLNLTAPLN